MYECVIEKLIENHIDIIYKYNNNNIIANYKHYGHFYYCYNVC